MNAGVRQVCSGMYGTVTYNDRHVSEPIDPDLLEIAEVLSTLPYADRLEALIPLAEAGYDTEFLEHLAYRAMVKRVIMGNKR